MKVCVVGSGNEGTGIAALLAVEQDVDEIVFADIDLARAQAAADHVRSLGDRVRAKLRVRRVDAAEMDDVAQVAAGSNLVFHGILPQFNLPVMRACLQVGAHYCDLLSLSSEVPGTAPAETIEAQLALDGEFRRAGLTAFPCIGISPGWTTIAAKHLVNQFEVVDRLAIRNIDWIDSQELLACAPPSVILEMWLGPPGPVRLRDGRVEPVDLLASEEIYQFPAPIGRQGIFTQTFGIDGIIINKYAGKRIPLIEEKGAVLSGGLGSKDLWIKAIQQQTSKHTGAENMLGLFGKSFVASSDIDFRSACDSGRIRNAAFASAVEVTGMCNGERVRHTLSCLSTLEATRRAIPWAEPGVFATIGGLVIELLLMLGRNQFNRRGVFTAASIDDPAEIFRRIGQRGQLLGERIERGGDV